MSTCWNVAPVQLRDASYQINLGPEKLWSQDSAFSLGAATNEIYAECDDFSVTTHKAWASCEHAQLAGLLASSSAAVVDPGGGGGTVAPIVSYLALDIEGNGWTGLPGTVPRVILHSTSATLISQGDPSSLGTFNSRHLIVNTPSVPIVIDSSDKLTVEVQSGQGGSGSGRWVRVYRAIIRFGLRTVDPAGGFLYTAL